MQKIQVILLITFQYMCLIRYTQQVFRNKQYAHESILPSSDF